LDDEIDLFGPDLTFVTVERVPPEEYRRLLTVERPAGAEQGNPVHTSAELSSATLPPGGFTGPRVDVFRWLGG